MIKNIFKALTLSLIFSTSAYACTGISLTTTSSQYIQARTLEWGGSNMASKLIIVPVGYKYTSLMPNNQNGLSFKSKYGFIGITVSNDKFIAEGINQKGLTAGLYFFKDHGSLEKYNSRLRYSTITDLDFVRWVLSNFATISKLEKALSKIHIVPVYMDEKGNPSPSPHWRVTDATGKSIVIEIVNHGEIKIFNNPVGVITNSPGFEWQLTNLNNYVNLKPGTSGSISYGKTEVKSFGVGTGFLGLPGDISPPSRFVRAAFYVNTAPKLETAKEAVSQAFTILNNFDIPIGSEFSEAERKFIPKMPSATQWTSVIDQSNGYFYYKTMYNSQVQKINVNKINFNVKNEIIRPLDSGKFTTNEIDFSNTCKNKFTNT